MIDVEEAKVRIALAQLEARRAKEKSIKRSANVRFAGALIWTIGVAISAFYLQGLHPGISPSAVLGIFFVFVISAGWNQYQTTEELTKLRLELEQLKDEIKNKTA
jgi:hypothetical protein